MNYEDYDGLALAKLVRDKEVSPGELLEEANARLNRLNPILNAVITPMYDAVVSRSGNDGVTGPFAGVPFLVKDLMLFFSGERMSNGSRSLRKYIPERDCGQAEAIKAAGFSVFGKTNCSELGTQPLTNPVAFGPTANPWDTSLNAGGSSGGSSAAVAARIVPMAASSDGGGSIRLPASYCGVFGFKPSRRLNPFESTRAWGGAVATNVTTLSVRDSAAYLDWTSKRVQPEGDTPRPGSLLARTFEQTHRLRIGFTCASPIGTPVDPVCVEAVEHTAGLLEELGHIVEPCSHPYDGYPVMRALLKVLAAYTYRDLQLMAEWTGTDWRRLQIETPTRFIAEMGRNIGERELGKALAAWQLAADAMERCHERYDVLLTPVAATPPLAHDALSPGRGEAALMRFLSAFRLGGLVKGDGVLDQAIKQNLGPLPFLQIANITGQPAMSVPLFWTNEGLPIGSHLMAARGEDGLLFNLAHQLEEAQPWFHVRPTFDRNS